MVIQWWFNGGLMWFNGWKLGENWIEMVERNELSDFFKTKTVDLLAFFSRGSSFEPRFFAHEPHEGTRTPWFLAHHSTHSHGTSWGIPLAHYEANTWLMGCNGLYPHHQLIVAALPEFLCEYFHIRAIICRFVEIDGHLLISRNQRFNSTSHIAWYLGAPKNLRLNHHFPGKLPYV